MSLVYVLVQAGEGNTDYLFVGGSISDLIRQVCAASVFRSKHSAAEDETFYSEQLGALLDMLLAAPTSEGRHKLLNIEPQWQEWTLLIQTLDGAA